MPFDFNKLMADPMFQQGLATLGGAANSPGLMNAYNALQAKRKAELEAQQQQMAREQHEAELEQSRVRNQLYGAQVKAQERNLELQARKDEAILAFVKRRQQANLANPSMVEQGGDSGASAAPIPPQQPALVPPPEPVGKYGTPIRILDGLEHTESNGNPNAIGPLISPKIGRAMGAYQFTQPTINQLKAEGIVFNPFNKEQSREAADYYIQKLIKQHGSLEKALAVYGGFKTKDPTRYVSGIMGSPEKQAAQHNQANQLAAQSAKHKQLQEEAGALQLLSGDMGGLKTLVDAEKPDYELPKLAIQATETNIKKEKLEVDKQAERRHAASDSRIAEKDQREASEKKSKAHRVTANVDSYLRRMGDTAKQLKTHPGLNKITGTLGGLISPRLLGEDARNADAILQQLKGQIFTASSAALRQASESGASVGQQSDVEGQKIEAAMGRLSQAQSLQEFQNALDDIVKLSTEARGNMRQAYKIGYGEDLEIPYDAQPDKGQGNVRTVVRTGRRKDGTRVIQYSDGSIENVK